MDLSEYRERTFPLIEGGDLGAANVVHTQGPVYVDSELAGYAFIEEIEAAFPGVTHNQHGYVVPWSNKSTSVGIRSMKMLQDALAAEGLTAVPYYGTLLGMTRDDALIPWDDDVDMMILNLEPRPMRETVHYVNDQVLALAQQALPNTDRYPTHIERLFTHVPLRHMLDNQVNKIDLFMPVAHENGVSVWIPADKHRPATFDFSTTTTTTFGGHQFEVPAETEALLQFLYGDDWRTPIKCHRFRTGLVVGQEPSDNGAI